MSFSLFSLFFSQGMGAKFVAPPCDYHRYDSNVNNCLLEFNSSMATSGYQEECPWPTVKRQVCASFI